MQMEFLQAQVPSPKISADYKKTIFSFDTKLIHNIDQMDMHRQSEEIIFSTMTNIAIELSKLRTYLSNVQTRLKLENISSLAKDTRIKTLEDLVIKMGYDPSDVKAVEEAIKKKKADIAALRKQLKFPSIEDPLAKEIEESEQRK